MLYYNQLAQLGLSDAAPSREDCLRVLTDNSLSLPGLSFGAYQIRHEYFGRRVQVHVINNAQSGSCPEDCGYCGQSKISDSPIQPYQMKSDEQMLAEAQQAAANGAHRYCMVYSGRGPTPERVEHLCELIREIKAQHPIEVCLSAGLLEPGMAEQLADAGLDRLNHNLNTSRRHYPSICTTHTYDDRLATLRSARQAGIGVCSGVIIGMGETHEDIVDVALELRELQAPSIPVNFLLDIEGNPVTGDGSLTPEYCVRVLCLFRFINPRAEIRIAAGREQHLRGLQSQALYAANSLFVDGYLLAQGQGWSDTYRLIVDAGFEPDYADGAGELLSALNSSSPPTAPGPALLKPEHLRSSCAH